MSYLDMPDKSRIEWFSQVNPATTLITVATRGTTLVPTLDGTETAYNDEDGHWINHATTTLLNSMAGWSSATFTHTQTRFNPTMTFVMKTDGLSYGNLSGHRIGLGPSDLYVAGAPTKINNTVYFSSGLDWDGTTDTSWQAVSVDNSGNMLKTNTGVPLTNPHTPTKYVLTLKLSSSSALFYINDTLVATHLTNLPDDSTGLNYSALIKLTAIAGTARNIKMKRIHCVQN